MSYKNYHANRDEIAIRVRSLRGETIDLSVPRKCKTGDLLDFLINEYGYSDKTCLLHNNVPVDVNTYVMDYPYDSLTIAIPYQHSVPHTQSHRRQEALPVSCSDADPYSKSSERDPGHHWAPQPGVETPPPPLRQQQGLQRVQNQNKSNAEGIPNKSHPPATMRSRSNASDYRRGNQTPSSRGAIQPTLPPEGGLSTPQVVDSLPKSKPTTPRQGYNDTPSTTASVNCPARTTKHCQALPRGISSPHGSSHKKPSVYASAKNSPTSLHARESISASSAEGNGIRGQNGNLTEARPTPPQSSRLTIQCRVPAQHRCVNVELSSDATVADLMLSIVAEVPEAATGKLVFRTKVLPQSPETTLFNVGIRTDCMVFVASGEYNNPDFFILEEADVDVNRIENDIENATTEFQRKGYYEELMRVLFRLDSLQDLRGQWKQKRKDMVKRITALQDKLNVDINGAPLAADRSTDSGVSAFSYAQGPS